MRDSPRFDRACRRRVSRFRPSHGATATIRFELADGSDWTLNLVEISEGGVAFGLNDEDPRLQVGARIDSVAIQVGDVRVAGSIRVSHVTTEFAAGMICGAAFTPSTALDERSLARVLETLATRDQRPG